MDHTKPPVGPRHSRRQTRASTFIFSLIQGAPHDTPENYFDKLPKLNGSLKSLWNNILNQYGTIRMHMGMNLKMFT